MRLQAGLRISMYLFPLCRVLKQLIFITIQIEAGLMHILLQNGNSLAQLAFSTTH